MTVVAIGCTAVPDSSLRGWRPSETFFGGLLEATATVTNPAVRRACTIELVRQGRSDYAFLQLRNYLNFGTEAEKDLAALVLFKIGTAAANREVIPYYAARLRDEDYVVRDEEGSVPFITGGAWEVVTQSNGVTRSTTVPMRHVFHLILEIGKPAVPYLVDALRDQDQAVRENAYVLLREITGLDIQYSPDEADSIAALLRRTRWLSQDLR